ncbi:putative zinc finger protein [Geothermobacter ehrlichii]|uniref:Putative zinc finger protein n=1 Tax=Geothermobacter ehrlichii TaxID=213224 RepID=A0A5D3WJR8_9BACT|nr:zf-HC2 domain-containing protein [Geothermobacter ehrlichii]TYO99215.1 putative zinc finger protein [Geothermobacter ehrlichii]
MNSKDCRQHDLLLYHYRELSADRAAAVERHLASCAACREELERIAADLALIGDRIRLSDEEKKRFARRVVDSVGQRRQRRWLPGPLPALALGTVAALSLLLVLWKPGTIPVPQKTSPRILVEIDVLEQLDLLQDLELLQDLDLLQDLEELG